MPSGSTEKSLRSIHFIGDAFVYLSVGNLKEVPSWGHEISTKTPFDLCPGGSTLNTAVHLTEMLKKSAHKDAEVSISCAVGKDFYSSVITRHLDAVGVRRSISLLGGGTGACLVLRGQRQSELSFVTHAGATEEFSLQNVEQEAILEEANHLHIGGFYNCTKMQEELIPFLERCRERGITISVDPGRDGTDKWQHVTDLFPYIDVFLSNLFEAEKIAGTSNLIESMQYFQERIPLTVITMGTDGAIATDREKGIWNFSALQVENVVDETGAGDAFNAGFLYGWKALGSVEKGLKYGICSASVCIQKQGPCMSPNRLDEVERLVKSSRW